MAQVAEPVEAVIISGNRKGEIVRLPEEALSFAEVSNGEIKLLNDALDGLIAAFDRLSEEVRLTIETFREKE